MLGAEYEAFEASLETAPVRGLRINPLKGDTDAIREALAKEVGEISKIPFAREGYTFAAEHIGSSPLHHAGAIYVQEPAAMAPVAAVDIQPHWWVADLCASPGGKSTQIAAQLSEDGLLLSNEYTRSRVSTLCGNLERMGVRRSVVTSMDVPTLANHYEGCFDLVVVDAPCSGEGMFRKNPDAVSEWSETSPAFCADRQYGILKAAAKMVKADGWLVYSTCTFAPEENEWQVARFLAENDDFFLTAPNEAVAAVSADGIAGGFSEADGFAPAPYTLTEEEAKLCRRFYPHVFDGEGQFLAVMRRSEGGSEELCKDSSAPLSKEEKSAAEAFLKEALTPEGVKSVLPNLRSRNGMVFVHPDLPVPAKGVYAAGVNVGSVTKGRLIPHHQFFSAYGDLFRNRIDLAPEDRNLAAYLHGDTIPADFNGWGVVCVCGAAIGGVKASGGVAKNHYPKGLRK